MGDLCITLTMPLFISLSIIRPSDNRQNGRDDDEIFMPDDFNCSGQLSQILTAQNVSLARDLRHD